MQRCLRNFLAKNNDIENDLAICGYFLYIAGSILYFVQAFAPWYEIFYVNQADAIMGIAAGWVFITESLLYIIGWYLGRLIARRNGLKTKLSWYNDYNWWGNILFLIGSIGYLITAEAYFYGVYAYEAAWGNLSLAILFQIDSILYVFAMNQGSTSKAATNVAVLRSADQKRLGVIKVFISEIDYYFLATVGFIIGSLAYVYCGVYDVMPYDTSCPYDIQGGNSTLCDDYVAISPYESNLSWGYMIGAIIFIIDSVLYLISGLQHRNHLTEVPLLRRKSTFFIEKYAAEAPESALEWEELDDDDITDLEEFEKTENNQKVLKKQDSLDERFNYRKQESLEIDKKGF